MQRNLNPLEKAIGIGFFLALLLLVAWATLSIYQPQAFRQAAELELGLTAREAETSLAPERVDALYRRILELGSRVPGKGGHQAVQDWLKNYYSEHGLEVSVLPGKVVAPVTSQNRLFVASGADEMTGTEALSIPVYPFPPNGFQPVVATPEDGARELVLLDAETLKRRESFEGVVGVIRADQIPEPQGLAWTRYAELGVEGLILCHPDGIEALPWQRLIAEDGFASALPVNFPRLAAGPAVLDLIGTSVRLDVRSAFEAVPAGTVVARLPASHENGANDRPDEAVVLPVAYDQFSLLPDYAAAPGQTWPLAVHAALVDAAVSLGSERERDLIFVATGGQSAAFAGQDQLLRALGSANGRTGAAARLRGALDRHEKRLEQLESILGMVSEPGFLDKEASAAEGFEELPAQAKSFYDDQAAVAVNQVAFDLAEVLLQRKIEFEKGDTLDLERPAYRRFLDAQFAYDAVASAAGLPPDRLAGLKVEIEGPHLGKSLVRHHQIDDAIRERFETLDTFHRTEKQRIEIALELNAAFSRYEDLTVVGMAPMPKLEGDAQAATSELSFVLGGSYRAFARAADLTSNAVTSLLEAVARPAGLVETLRFAGPSRSRPVNAIYQNAFPMPVVTENWNAMGYRAFTLINTDRSESYRQMERPVPTDQSASGMRPELRYTANLLTALASGYGDLPAPPNVVPSNYSGHVYAANIGRSMLPNHPLPNSLVVPKLEQSDYTHPALAPALRFFTDPYGAYSLPDASSYFKGGNQYNPQCVFYDEAGRVRRVKDESPGTQQLYKSIYPNANETEFRDVNLVAFRASPVAVVDLVNPQTLRPFTSVSLIERQSLSGFEALNTFSGDDGAVSYIPPAQSFFMTFSAGSPGNELVQTVRSVITGPPPADDAYEDGEISGEGFLAANETIMEAVALPQARSMHRLNEGRLQLQLEKNLAEAYVVDFHETSGELLNEAEETEEQGLFQRILTARDSLTYSIIVHPLLKGNINEAVVSILWYMALLVPFIFFAEKLVFGFTDIRKQLAAQTVTFLLVFLLLRLLHPAFDMIRSSLMILLGFIILLISAAITLLFSGKFRENLNEIKGRRGQAVDAEANTLGIFGTAFMLGLNNMRRRKVRTGLTCATLVLITFAMIAFTSIQRDFESTETALGPASYQGLLIKNDRYRPISETELYAIESSYGNNYPIAPRSMLLGTVDIKNNRYAPNLSIRHRSAEGRTVEQSVGSIIRLSHHEPLRADFPLVTDPYWFPDAAELRDDEALPILIPANIAQALEIRPEAVNAGGVPVRINDRPFIVRGIFDPAAYGRMNDLDDRPILPFDIRGLDEVENVADSPIHVLGEEDGIKVSPENLIIAPFVDLGIPLDRSEQRLVSVALDLEGAPYRTARDEVGKFLEQRGRPAFYGLDGTAFRGSRMRVSDFSGIVDLVIPLIIAALTVLNTMKGSVYERSSEIFVFNAVGIAPRFIFFMFFAEAFVYAVVGSVLGYILAQGTGAALTALDLTGGLNMTFASVNSIYASLAVVAAVFLSTYYPARSAMEIAAPSEEAGWELPEPDENAYRFNLPFTFDPEERVAVLAFFQRYLEDHGEGGIGGFSAGAPVYNLQPIDAPGLSGPSAVIPELSATIWLKPYDLGVSQRFTIATPLDPETGDYIAAIELYRTSGSRDSWIRVNHPFLADIRRQLLHWRAVSPEMKVELKDEALAALQRTETAETETHGQA